MSLSISPAKMTDKIELFHNAHSGLAWGFQVNPSSCGNHKHYEQYIRLSAADDKRCGRGTTHVFVREENGQRQILGFITLRASSYVKIYGDKFEGNPALEILELAVDGKHEGQGIGAALIKFAFATAVDLNAQAIGIQYIVLCADYQAVSYYEKFGFECIEDQGKVPRDGWNSACIPMFIKLPEIT